ncbi:MAG: 30S ribosomal protein S20, partial [Vallitaleaceae bacterium]|nr:30S ribosomal protein S20 [Vallitaleaceae bacterium]
SKVKTDIKKVVVAAGSGTKTEAQENLLIAISEIDKAKAKGVINKSAASRKISRLTKLVNKTA